MKKYLAVFILAIIQQAHAQNILNEKRDLLVQLCNFEAAYELSDQFMTF